MNSNEKKQVIQSISARYLLGTSDFYGVQGDSCYWRFPNRGTAEAWNQKVKVTLLQQGICTEQTLNAQFPSRFEKKRDGEYLYIRIRDDGVEDNDEEAEEGAASC